MIIIAYEGMTAPWALNQLVPEIRILVLLRLNTLVSLEHFLTFVEKILGNYGGIMLPVICPAINPVSQIVVYSFRSKFAPCLNPSLGNFL